MRIELISQEEFKILSDIQKNNPILTLENKGWETPDESLFTEDDKSALNTITEILRKSILGFRSFTNFKHSNDGRIRLRFQYDWEADYEPHERKIGFTGVGYILLDELLNGFES